jgi:YhcH/YjgK/YiaL family protein
MWEAHRDYIDVQFVSAGVEAIAWSPIQQMTVTTPHDPQKDTAYFDGPTRQILRIDPHSFAIFMPHDVHRPCLIADTSPTAVRKIVVKVAVK